MASRLKELSVIRDKMVLRRTKVGKVLVCRAKTKKKENFQEPVGAVFVTGPCRTARMGGEGLRRSPRKGWHLLAGIDYSAVCVPPSRAPCRVPRVSFHELLKVVLKSFGCARLRYESYRSIFFSWRENMLRLDGAPHFGRTSQHVARLGCTMFSVSTSHSVGPRAPTTQHIHTKTYIFHHFWHQDGPLYMVGPKWGERGFPVYL